MRGVEIIDIRGTLADGTDYAMWVPPNWNGTLVNDLDFVRHAERGYEGFFEGHYYEFLLERGYAASGTRRHPQRMERYDPIRELEQQVEVIELFATQFERPNWVIQHGGSGGGAIAVGMAEFHADVIDGSIPLCFQTGLVIANVWMDRAVAVKALLAPDEDLPVVGIAPADADAALEAWHAAINSAQQTAVGRARIALATTLAQSPGWGSVWPSTLPRPRPDDVDAVQQAMHRSIMAGMESTVRSRPLVEQSAGGVPSWNTGVDYVQYYDNADPAQAWVVRALYDKAGLSTNEIGMDLERVNEQPRISAQPEALEYWRLHPRLHDGKPGVPMLHMHTIGDSSLPPVLMQGYGARVHANGLADRYRQVFVESADHGAIRVCEAAAAVETMVRRLETGSWGDTTRPRVLNTLAASMGLGPARFVHHRLPQLNRACFPDSRFPTTDPTLTRPAWASRSAAIRSVGRAVSAW